MDTGKIIRSTRTLPGRWIRGLTRRLGEVVNVSATYLGLAVLIVAASIVLLQPVRDQARLAYEAVLQTLGPASADGFLADLARFARGVQGSAEAGVEAARADDDVAATLSVMEPGAAVSLEDLRREFDRMLDDHPDDPGIAGVSSAQFQSLRRYLSRKYRIAQNVAGALIQTAHALGRAQGVDPQLLLAIIAIESRYNPFAESHVGAQGLMQVMPRVHRDKFEALGLDIAAAVEPVPNMIVGTRVYTDCRRRRGSIPGALACYVGATGPGDGGYGAKVLAERRRIARASGTAVADLQ